MKGTINYVFRSTTPPGEDQVNARQEKKFFGCRWEWVEEVNNLGNGNKVPENFHHDIFALFWDIIDRRNWILGVILHKMKSKMMIH